jgi:hypothetical protein
MINAAIVGLGRWGRNIVEASLNHERFKITRAVEPEIDSARDFCTTHHLELFDNLDAVLGDSNVDAVLPATPHSLHTAQVMACAAARKDVFCEKPLALRQADAARMLEACRKAGATLATRPLNRRQLDTIKFFFSEAAKPLASGYSRGDNRLLSRVIRFNGYLDLLGHLSWAVAHSLEGQS